MSGLLAVQARVGQIQARIDALVGSPPAASPSSAAAFASALSAAAGPSGLAGSPGQAGPTGHDLVEAASEYLGVPYRWGGTDPATGLDCSGLVQRAFADLGVEVPRVVADQAHVGEEVPSLAQARPGDLVVYLGSPNHVGIYVGDGKMLHAPRTGDVVKISDVRSSPPSTIRRVLPAADEVGVAAASAGSAASGVPYAGLFGAAERRHGLPPGLLAAVARVESNFDADAVSPAGAIGLMQIMPGTAADLGVDPRDPVQAVDGAARYLRTQLDGFGDLGLALAAYNAGPGAVRRHGGIPPYAETQAYVTKVLDARSDLTGGRR